MRWKDMTLSGWGRTSRAAVRACRPERFGEIAPSVAEGMEDPNGILPFGAGRSYGDAALNGGGRVLLTERLDRFLAFDEATGDLVCEPGVTFDRIVRTFLPRGWIAPVSPGTAYATVGGAVANDVHGKNHEHAGSFGEHVRWIDLLMPADPRTPRRISPADEPELFAATVGGIGLTGLTTQICFRLRRVPSSDVIVREERIADIDAFLDAMRGERARNATYSVGWIDCVAGGAALGRGILQTADPAPAQPAGASAWRPARKRRVPIDFPGFALSPTTVRLFNDRYFGRVPADGRTRMLPLPTFLYPLDALLDWNRIYGKRGFYQFQCVVPDAEAARGIRRLIEEISGSRAASFLAVIKMMGREGPGHLSFAMPGCTLALDFPKSDGTRELIGRLNRIALDHGGRVYLAKDALLTPETFAAMYPKLERFRAVLAQVDPDGRFNSDMARRLGIRPGAAASAAVAPPAEAA
jgi:decaprenylphospho-beta-D-ribofuranose 2-oxidase